MSQNTKILIVIDKLGKIDGKLIDLPLSDDKHEIENLLTNRFKKYGKRIDFVIVIDMVEESCYSYNFPQQEFQVTDLEGLTKYYEECINSDNVSFYKHDYIDFKSYVQTNILNNDYVNNRYFANIDYSLDQMFEVLYSLRISSYKNIFPGYSQDDNIYEEDYLFETEDIATEECFTILQMFDSMPDEIEIFRSMVIDNIDDLDIDDLGNYWSFDKNSAILFAGTNLTKENLYLFYGTIEKQFINWPTTILNYCQNSMFESGDEENELYIQDNQEHNINNVKWKRLSEATIDEIEDSVEIEGTVKTIMFDFTKLEHVDIDMYSESIYRNFYHYTGILEVSVIEDNITTDRYSISLHSSDANEILSIVLNELLKFGISLNINDLNDCLVVDKLIFNTDSLTIESQGDGLWHYNPYDDEDEENNILSDKVNQRFL